MPATVPEGAAHFVVESREIVVSAKRPEIDPEEHTIEEATPFSPGVVRFRRGDELPPALGEQVYPSFGDRLAVFDADGQRLDGPLAEGGVLTTLDEAEE